MFKEGNQIMVSLENIQTNRPKKKWDNKWDGPYKVLKAYRGAIIIDLSPYIKVNNLFYISKCRTTWRRRVILRVTAEDINGHRETHLCMFLAMLIVDLFLSF